MELTGILGRVTLSHSQTLLLLTKNNFHVQAQEKSAILPFRTRPNLHGPGLTEKSLDNSKNGRGHALEMAGAIVLVVIAVQLRLSRELQGFGYCFEKKMCYVLKTQLPTGRPTAEIWDVPSVVDTIILATSGGCC